MEKILDLNIKNTELIIREAFLKVVGEEYRDIVNKRLNRAVYIPYNNYRGIEWYYDYLLKTKRNSLACDFFESIGLDISKYRGIYEDSPYYTEFEELISTYFGTTAGFEMRTYNLGISSFKVENQNNDELIEEEQILFLNNYLFNGKEVINKDNFKEFKYSSLYRSIVLRIRTWIPRFESRKKEYKEYKESLSYLLEYVEESKKRLMFIHSHNRVAVYNYIEKYLPVEWLNNLNTKYKDKFEKSSILGDVDDYFGFAIFDTKYDKLLENGSAYEKKAIMEKRLRHFQALGYLNKKIPYSNEELESLYKDVMERDNTKVFIPSKELISDLQKLKEELISESEKALIIGDFYFQKNTRENRFSEETIDAIATQLVDTPILVSNATCNNEDYTLLYYTIRNYEGGMLDEILIHEFIHLFAIFIRRLGIISSGFDYLLTNDNKRNPYNDKYRIYERFNEVLTDILAAYVLHILHDNLKIFLLEDENVVRSSINKNTHSVLKSLVYPFYQEYIDVIIESFMKEDLNIIFDQIGKDNFDELVDIINYVDNLINKFNLVEDIENNDESSLIYGFYLKKIEELIDLYEKMRNHKENKKRTLI